MKEVQDRLGKVWQERKDYNDQLYDFHIFLRDTNQLNNTSSSQEVRELIVICRKLGLSQFFLFCANLSFYNASKRPLLRIFGDVGLKSLNFRHAKLTVITMKFK